MSRPEEKAILLRRRGNSLVAVDEHAQEAIGRLGAEADIYVWLKQARNPKHHRKFFALVNTIFKAQSKYPTQESLLTAIKIAVGHVDTFVGADGKVYYVVRSLSFDAMDQAEFDRFYEAVIDIVVTRLLPGVRRSDLKRELEEFTR